MDNRYNLIYNGDFQHGSDGWILNSNTSYDPTASYNGSYGGLVQSGNNWVEIYSRVIPVNTADTYTFNFDVRYLSAGTSTCYSYIKSYDKYGEDLMVSKLTHYGDTTLAVELKDGDTAVTVANATGLYENIKQNYNNFGICDSPAWGYKRMLIGQRMVASATNTGTNVVTLTAAWTGGTWKVGTPVARFRDGGTYIYPSNWSSGTIGDWKHKSYNLTPSTLRFTTVALRIGQSVGTGWKQQLTNYSLQNTSRAQERDYDGLQESGKGKANIRKTGTAECNGVIEQNVRNVRYIRDWCSGSTANAAHHWCEIPAWDVLGRNVAFGSIGSGVTNSGAYALLGSVTKSGVNNSTNANYIKTHAITKGTHSPSSTYIGYGSNAPTAIIIDLGQVFQIEKIIVWHYWGDGRTYGGTKTEISQDKANWETVFDSAVSGTYPETSTGNIITFGNSNMSITRAGYYKPTALYEI